MNAFIQIPAAPLNGDIQPPSSKNYTTRYILASCLADGRSTVRKPAVQDDAVALVRCCRLLGASISAFDRRGESVPFELTQAKHVDHLVIEGFGTRPALADPETPIDPENAGAVLRLLLGTATLIDGTVRFQTERFPHSLGTRPNRDLLEALAQLGVLTDSTGSEGRLPITLNGGRDRIRDHIRNRREREHISPGEPVTIRVSGTLSSQFLSSLLFLAPLLDEHIAIEVVDDLKSKPLIITTLAVLRDAGIHVEAATDLMRFLVPRGQRYTAREWSVNGDWPGTAAILGAAAVVPHSRIRVSRLYMDEQGERRCLDLYRSMGCTADLDDDVLLFSSPESLRAAEIDGDTCTDAVPAMMGAAACAFGESTFTGINNLQFKECDRVREPIAEMRRIFAGTDASATWEPDDQPRIIRVRGDAAGFEGAVTVDGRGDHRVIMLLSIMALRARKPVTIQGAGHVAKSFPLWFDTLTAMGARVHTDQQGIEER